jgi:hypothetical protein
MASIIEFYIPKNLRTSKATRIQSEAFLAGVTQFQISEIEIDNRPRAR